MAFLEHTKNFDTFMQVLLRDPDRYLPIVEFRDNMTKNFTELSWADCELIGAELSRENGSEFCTGVRVGIAKALNGDSSKLESDKFKPVLEFARKVNTDASSITESDIQPLRDAGWSDQTVEDIVGLVAMTNVYNILAKGLGFKGVAEEKFDKIGAATVAKQGYKALYTSFLDAAGKA